MDEKPDQIMSHIEAQRDQLGRNLNELETRVKGATDWRLQFDRNPMLMMGVALGGGLLLGTVVGGGKRGRSTYPGTRKYWTSTPTSGASTPNYSYGPSSSASASAAPSAGSSLLSSSPAVREQRKKATDTLEHIKAALIGFATAKVKEFMTEALPGFDQHFADAERRNQEQGGSSSSLYDSESGSSAGSGQTYGGQSYGSQGSQGTSSNQATTRTEQSANSPYTRQGAGQNTGMNI